MTTSRLSRSNSLFLLCVFGTLLASLSSSIAVGAERTSSVGAVQASKYMFSAERVAKALGCQMPVASLDAATKTSLSETFAIRCADGRSMSIRCDNGECGDVQPTAAASSSATMDNRPEKLSASFQALLDGARKGTTTYLAAAREHRRVFESLYPEQRGNPLLNEYFAYMAVPSRSTSKTDRSAGRI